VEGLNKMAKVPSRVVGFYTDKQKRVRPITKGIPHVKPLKQTTSNLRIPKRAQNMIRIPKAPRKVDYSKVDGAVSVADVDVKRLAQDNVAVYVDGEGNVISTDYTDEKGKSWTMPHLGSGKLRDESIYTEKSVDHPAKMNPLWAQRMIQEYSEPGDTVLDPMAGIGTTGIEASRLGRNAIMVDCEDKWVNQMKHNSEKLRKSGQMRGSISVRKGDARNLNMKRKVDAIMFSPPYLLGEGGPKSTWRDYGDKQKFKQYDVYAKPASDNIGLKKGDGYSDQMSEVYGKCHQNLKPNGLLIVNVKDKIKDRHVQKMAPSTTKLIEDQGFKFKESRNVFASPGPGRALYEKHYSDAPHIRHETFLVFKKK